MITGNKKGCNEFGCEAMSILYLPIISNYVILSDASDHGLAYERKHMIYISIVIPVKTEPGFRLKLCIIIFLNSFIFHCFSPQNQHLGTSFIDF